MSNETKENEALRHELDVAKSIGRNIQQLAENLIGVTQ